MIITRFFSLANVFYVRRCRGAGATGKSQHRPLPPAGSRLVGENKFHVVENDGGSLEAIAKKI